MLFYYIRCVQYQPPPPRGQLSDPNFKKGIIRKEWVPWELILLNHSKLEYNNEELRRVSVPGMTRKFLSSGFARGIGSQAGTMMCKLLLFQELTKSRKKCFKQMLKNYNLLQSSAVFFFPLIRLTTNKLMALFNMEWTKGKQSLQKPNVLKIILDLNEEYIDHTDILFRSRLQISLLMKSDFKRIN